MITTESPEMPKPIYDKYTLIALCVSLILYPLLYALDFFGGILFPGLNDVFLGLVNSDRAGWWLFWTTNMLYHWIPVGFIWLAIRKNNESWKSIGLDWEWFRRRNAWFVALGVIMVVSAFIMPQIHYDGVLPSVSQTTFRAPVSTLERLFMILFAITAAITEEVIFRGFAFTRLRKIIPSVWLILPITALAFMLIHGQPESFSRAVSYILPGLVFGVVFILMKLKRLEILILVHLFIGLGLVIAP